MTVLDISRAAQPEAISDTELTVDDTRLQLMEEMLRDRGYSRNQHGFWVVPESRMTAKVKSELITRETPPEDEQ
jgi:hypothetical protein